jgi:hypothetical protein
VIVDFIPQAKESLDIAVEEIDSMPTPKPSSTLAGEASMSTSTWSRTYVKSKLKAKPDPPVPQPRREAGQARRRVPWGAMSSI